MWGVTELHNWHLKHILRGYLELARRSKLKPDEGGWQGEERSPPPQAHSPRSIPWVTVRASEAPLQVPDATLPLATLGPHALGPEGCQDRSLLPALHSSLG